MTGIDQLALIEGKLERQEPLGGNELLGGLTDKEVTASWHWAINFYGDYTLLGSKMKRFKLIPKKGNSISVTLTNDTMISGCRSHI